jgi:hypothetical protein
MNMKEINEGLKIVKLNNQKFLGLKGYYMITGYCLKHDTYGYVAFSDSPFYPYIPGGGRKVLQNILDGGGFNSFDGMLFIA